jgi:hypothetical protein
MKPTASEFCREQAARLLKLAEQTADQTIRVHLIHMAEEWEAEAKAKDLTAKKIA